jgi:GNAT superfamily N-acetyltransferase
MHVRVADNRDVPGVVRVIKAVYDEYNFTWDPGDYHADLYDLEAHYGNEFLVAEVDGQVVGTVALALHDLIPGPEGEPVKHDGAIRIGGTDCSLERLYVHPEARRGGVGRTLTEVVFTRARTVGRTNLEMWSDKRFVDAHRLYQKLGARVVGERICHDPDQSPEWGLFVTL